MHEYLDYLEKREKDFQMRKKEYFEEIAQIAKRFGGKAYVFGSYIKGESLPGSDVDVLVIVPNNVDRLQVLYELREKIRNRKLEFHVLNEDEGILFLSMLDKYIELNVEK